MEFNPDEYLQEDQPQDPVGFNPDAYLNEVPEQEQEDYTKRVAQSFGEASGNIANVLFEADKRISEKTPTSVKDIDLVLDSLEIGGEVVEAGTSLFTEAYEEIPKDVRKKVERTLGEGAKTLYNALNIGGALDTTVSALTDLAERYPKQAAAVEDIMQITAASKVAGAVKGAGRKVTPHKWGDVVMPAPSKAELKRRALNSGTSITGTTDVPKIQSWQKDLIKTLKGVEGVHPSNRNQVNLNAVISGISKKAKSLDDRLASSKVKLNPLKVGAKVKRDLEREFMSNPVFDGATKKEIERAYDRAMRFVNEAGATPRGIWQARKKLDNFYEFHKGEKFVSGSTNASVASESYRIARESLNDILEKELPGAKGALKEMRNLYNARDILLDKAILDDPTLIGRFRDKVSKFVTLRPPVVRGGYYGPTNLPKQ